MASSKSGKCPKCNSSTIEVNLADILWAIKAPMCVVTPEGDIFFVSNELCRMTGLTRLELEGVPFIDLIHPINKEVTEKTLMANPGPDDSSEVDALLRSTSGGNTLVRWKISTHYDASKNIVCRTISGADISTEVYASATLVSYFDPTIQEMIQEILRLECPLGNEEDCVARKFYKTLLQRYYEKRKDSKAH